MGGPAIVSATMTRPAETASMLTLFLFGERRIFSSVYGARLFALL